MTRAVFLDRDGLLNELVVDPTSGLPESPCRVDQMTLKTGAGQALRRLRDVGYLLAVISNQPAAAKGKVTLAELGRIHERFVSLSDPNGDLVAEYFYCHHHPYGTDPKLTARCQCRKPAPGMILTAAKQFALALQASWVVGDSDVDIMAGQAAGCRTVLVEEPLSAHRRTGEVNPTATVGDLGQAVELIVTGAG